MKKTFKFIFAFLGLMFSFLIVQNVSADTYAPQNRVELPLAIEVDQSVTKEFVDSNGENNQVTITKIEDSSNTSFRAAWEYVSAQKAASGTYKVSYKRGVFNAGFTVKMDTRNITSAYDLWYRHAVGTNSANLSLESNKRATAYFQFQASVPWLNGPSWNGALRAQVDADHLVTYVM